MICDFEGFETKVSSVSIFNFQHCLNVPGDDDFDEDVTAVVYYSMEPEVRSYGLGGILVYIKKVTLDIDWSTPSDELTEEQKQALIAAGGYETRQDSFEGNRDITIVDGEDGWTVNLEEATFEGDGSFDFRYIEVNFKDKTVELS